MSKFETYLEMVRNASEINEVKKSKVIVSSGVYYTNNSKLVDKLVDGKTEQERYDAFQKFRKIDDKQIKVLTDDKYSSVKDFIQSSFDTMEEINGYTFIKDSDMKEFITQKSY